LAKWTHKTNAPSGLSRNETALRRWSVYPRIVRAEASRSREPCKTGAVPAVSMVAVRLRRQLHRPPPDAFSRLAHLKTDHRRCGRRDGQDDLLHAARCRQVSRLRKPTF